jgi:hypothetical protein
MKLFAFSFALMISSAALAADLLEEVDKYRNPSESYSMQVRIESSN